MTACIVCQRRQPYRPNVCDGDRRRLDHQLRELPDLYVLLPAALEAGDGDRERVSGTRVAPIPLSLDVVDLIGMARQPNPTDEARKHPEDQTGGLSVASVLDQWVREWREVRSKGEGLPAPTVPNLAHWLRMRLEWACDQHLAIDEFAFELRGLMSTIRSALTLRRHVDRLPAPCPNPECDMLTLHRSIDPIKGADSWIECGSCHRLWTEDEYRRLAIVLASDMQANGDAA